MRKNPRKTTLAMAVALFTILLALTACASESQDAARVEQLSATLTSEQARLESADQEKMQAETCYAEVAGWTSETETLDVPGGCIGAGDAGRIASKMASLAAGFREEIRRLELELQSAVGRIDSEKQRADDSEARLREDAEKTSGLRAQLAQAQQDLVTYQLESAEKINEGAQTIVDSTVNMTTTRSEISEESGATWLARFDSLEDAHDDLMEQRVQLADEKALLDATVANYVERNTKVERERLEEERKRAEERVTAAEEARERAVVARLHAEKEAERTMVTYQTKLEELSKREAAFNGKKAGNDAECRSAWTRIDAEIENTLQQTSLLPAPKDDTERSSRVAELQYKKNVIRSLWSEFSNVCRVSR